MTKKTYSLVSGLIGVAATTANILVAYFHPAMYAPIIAAIVIGAKAAEEILLLFVKEN